MKLFGLIGYPLANSFSQEFFSELFRREGRADVYQNFPLQNIVELKELIASHPELSGLNVTIPYKEQVISYLNELDEVARVVGAVNCICIRAIAGGRLLKGYNTDAAGFEKTMIPMINKHTHMVALVLGKGGASKAVSYVFKKHGIEVIIVSRNPAKGELSWDDLKTEQVAQARVIVNCTPLGMHPNENNYPQIPYDGIGPDHLCYDLIYLPEETLFLKKAAAQGAKIKNGLEMLHIQALESWRIWNEKC